MNNDEIKYLINLAETKNELEKEIIIHMYKIYGYEKVLRYIEKIKKGSCE